MLSYVGSLVAEALAEFWLLVRPGGISYELHWESFMTSSSHYILEGSLVGIIVYLVLQKGKPIEKEEPLTEQEVEDLCHEWNPQPLCPPMSDRDKRRACHPVVQSFEGPIAQVNGKEVVNFCSSDFLGISKRGEIMDACKGTLNKYGCGSCGPRGFYGTIDVHIQLEEQLSRFMGTEEAIIYSYDVATLPSIIPAFANRKDVIIRDEAANYPIQNGCNLSRSRIITFRHNDMEDLERIMQMVADEDRRQKKKLNRKYVVVEGIYHNLGDLAPLDKIHELKEKYKYRLIVDESLSLGVLGETGRGACEHFGILGRAEIVAASMGNSMGTVGGFCCGDREICDHQRLSGSGYCFSASLPPFLATAGIGALEYMSDQGQEALVALQNNASALRGILSRSLTDLRVFGTDADQLSPVILLRLSEPPPSEDAASELLEGIVERCLEQGVMVAVNPVTKLDLSRPVPSIRVVVTAQHNQGDLFLLVDALGSACHAVLRGGAR